MGRLVHLIFANGERYPMFVDGDGLPDFWVTLYVTEILRPSLKQSAITNTIRNILHLKLWEELNNRDLISEFSHGKFLSAADIFSLRDHCLICTRDLRKWSEVKVKKNVTKLSVNHPSAMRHMQAVSKSHSANRLGDIADFLYFTARAVLRERANFTSMTTDIDQMKKMIIAQRPKGLGGNGLANDPDSKAPPPASFKKLMSVVKVDSPDNPYKNPAIRIRNALMFDVLYQTGLRSGEILALQIDDVDFDTSSGAGKIFVVRRHDNPLDPRPIQPVPKTLGRVIPITADLAKRLRAYVMEVRSKVITQKSPPFLFVTHKRGQFQGQPLSESSFKNRVLGPAIATNPELFEEIARHGFRHNFNYLLSEKIDATNLLAMTDPTIKSINEKEEIQIRKDLNGHSSEKSGMRYNLRRVREKSNELMRKDMDELSKHLNKGKK